MASLTFEEAKSACQKDFRAIPSDMHKVCWDHFMSVWNEMLKDVPREHIDTIRDVVTEGTDITLYAPVGIRKILHRFCDALGLCHIDHNDGLAYADDYMDEDDEDNCMDLRPPSEVVKWKWRFTTKEPRRQRLERLLRQLTCDHCKDHWSPECDLFSSPSWPGKYCWACVDNLEYRDIYYCCDDDIAETNLRDYPTESLAEEYKYR